MLIWCQLSGCGVATGTSGMPQMCGSGARLLTVMSQIVQVVSMLEVPIMLGSLSFQSNDVSGEQNSVFLFCAGQDSRRDQVHKTRTK